MKDEIFYLRLGDIWNDLNSFLSELSMPTKSQKAITEIAKNLLRVKINSFFNDWLGVCYIPEGKNINGIKVESLQLREPSGIFEKRIFDKLHQCLVIIVHWWKCKKDLNQWGKTEKELKPIVNELKSICVEANRKPLEFNNVIAGLRKLAELIKRLKAGEYTKIKAEFVSSDLSELKSNILIEQVYLPEKVGDKTYFSMGYTKGWPRKEENLKTEEKEIIALINDAKGVLNNIEKIKYQDCEDKALMLLSLADELEKISGETIHVVQTNNTIENKADIIKDISENNSMMQIGKNLFQTEKEYRERIESFPVFGQKSNFVRSILNNVMRNRNDVIGILLDVFSPGRFMHLYWECYGLPDLAKEFAELDIDNHIVTLKKTLTKDECNQVISRVNGVFLAWQAWRKQALQNGIEYLRKKKMDKDAKLTAWIDWIGAHEGLKSQLGDIGIYELREYLENIAVEIDKRESELINSEVSKDNTKATIDNKDALTEEIINLDEDELELLNWFNEQYPSICYVKRYPKRDDKTKYNYARNLEKKGMIKRPAEKKRGHVITEKGRELIKKYYS